MSGKTFRCVCIPQLNTGQWVMQYTTLTACSLTLSGQTGQRQITCPIIPPRKRLSPDRLSDLGMQVEELSWVILNSGLLRSIPYHIHWLGCLKPSLFLSQTKKQSHYSSVSKRKSEASQTNKWFAAKVNKTGNHALRNSGVCSSLCILGSSQAVIRLNPLGSYVICCSQFAHSIKCYCHY